MKNNFPPRVPKVEHFECEADSSHHCGVVIAYSKSCMLVVSQNLRAVTQEKHVKFGLLSQTFHELYVPSKNDALIRVRSRKRRQMYWGQEGVCFVTRKRQQFLRQRVHLLLEARKGFEARRFEGKAGNKHGRNMREWNNSCKEEYSGRNAKFL